MALDMEKLNAFVGQFVGDLGAAVHSGMVVIGEKLGLYKALAEGPLNSAELAARTRTDERYVREWLSSQAAVPRIIESFRSGAGMGWHEHDDAVFHGCERFSRPSYAANLISSWIPSLHGVKAKLEAGARAADVGCGKGASTVLMAKAFPKSQFFGFDYHDKSIEGARAAAAREGLEVRLNFGVAKAKEFPGKDYDLVTVFDCLHDMGDPVGAATHVL